MYSIIKSETIKLSWRGKYEKIDVVLFGVVVRGILGRRNDVRGGGTQLSLRRMRKQ